MLPHYQRIKSKLISQELKAFVVSTKSVVLASILKIPFLVPQGNQMDKNYNPSAPKDCPEHESIPIQSIFHGQDQQCPLS